MYEEFRGDLHALHLKLLGREKRSDERSRDEEGCDLILRLVLQGLTGSFTSAFKVAEQLRRTESRNADIQKTWDTLVNLPTIQAKWPVKSQRLCYGERWIFRAHAYSALLIMWATNPPLFKMADIENGFAMQYWKPENENLSIAECFNYCQSNYNEVDEEDQFEFRFLELVIKSQGLVRGLRFRLTTSFNSSISADGDIMVELSRIRNDLSILLAESKTHGPSWVTISGTILQAIYCLSHALGRQYESSDLLAVKSHYQNSNDDTGLGNYWLHVGSAQISPSFTTPLTRNFDLRDDFDDFGGDCTMFLLPYPTIPPADLPVDYDPISETRLQSLDTLATRAKACFNEAFKCFQKSGALRGMAVAHLYNTCVTQITMSQLLHADTREELEQEEIGYLCSAKEHAMQVGDLQLVYAIHVIGKLSICPGGRLSPMVESWCDKEASPTLWLCTSLLCIRLGHYYRYHCGSSYKASQAYVAPGVVHAPAGFASFKCRIGLAIVRLLISQHNFREARSIISGFKKDWNSIRSQYLSVATCKGNPQAFFDDMRAREFIVHQSLRALVSLVFTTDCHYEQKRAFPDETTRELMSSISSLGHKVSSPQLAASLTRQFKTEVNSDADIEKEYRVAVWHNRQIERGEYEVADTKYTRAVQRGDLSDATEALNTFLNSEDRKIGWDTYTTVYCTLLLLKHGAVNKARETLSSWDARPNPKQDEDDAIGEYFQIDSQRAQRHQKLIKEELKLQCFIEVGDWPKALEVLESLEQLSPGWWSAVSSYSQYWPWQRCLFAGLIWENLGHPELAMRFYQQSWYFLSQTRLAFGDPERRRALFANPDVGRLVASMSRFYLRENKSPSAEECHFADQQVQKFIDRASFAVFGVEILIPESPELVALLILERSRARYVLEMMTFKDDPQARVELVEYYGFQNSIEGSRDDVPTTDQRPGDDARGKSLDALSNHHILIEELNPTLHQLFNSIDKDAVMIYPTISEDGLLLFVIDHSGILLHQWIDVVPRKASSQKVIKTRINLAYVRNLVTIILNAIISEDRSKAPLRSQMDLIRSQMDLSLKLLGKMLLQKAERYIEVKNHVIFVPSGDLSRLPLGLLPFQGRPLGLQRAVSQVPSLAVLRYLRSRSRIPERSLNISNIARPGNRKDYDDKKDPEKPLPMAGVEALMLSAFTGQRPIDAAGVSCGELQTHLVSSNILHLATHGTMDTGSPFNSSILVKEPFRVLDMLAVNTDIFLVVFSACLCGTGRASDTGDNLGFAHAVLASGAGTFLGALWEVNDLATLILMSSFYQTLIWHSSFGGETISLAQCWQMAIRTLADSRPEHIVTYLKFFLEVWDILEAANKKPAEFSAEGRRRLVTFLRNAGKPSYADEFDFSHPYYWAAFCMIGNAGQQIACRVSVTKEGEQMVDKMGAKFAETCNLK